MLHPACGHKHKYWFVCSWYFLLTIIIININELLTNNGDCFRVFPSDSGQPTTEKKTLRQKITTGPGPGTQEDSSRVASFPARNNYYVKLDWSKCYLLNCSVKIPSLVLLKEVIVYSCNLNVNVATLLSKI